jgi:hypothetical protein
MGNVECPQKQGDNPMHPAVAGVRANEDYSLSVVFDDGTEGLLDMKPYLGFGVFKRLQAPEAFKRVHVAFDTVQWDCGRGERCGFTPCRGSILSAPCGSPHRAFPSPAA